MDIIEEGFGFMLAFGDISWVPVLYSLQARYLVDNPMKLHWITTAAIVVLFGMSALSILYSQLSLRRTPLGPALSVHLREVSVL